MSARQELSSLSERKDERVSTSQEETQIPQEVEEPWIDDGLPKNDEEKENSSLMGYLMKAKAPTSALMMRFSSFDVFYKNLVNSTSL